MVDIIFSKQHAYPEAESHDEVPICRDGGPLGVCRYAK